MITPCSTFKKKEREQPIKKNEKVENNLNHQGWVNCSIWKSLSLRCFAMSNESFKFPELLVLRP